MISSIDRITVAAKDLLSAKKTFDCFFDTSPSYEVIEENLGYRSLIYNFENIQFELLSTLNTKSNNELENFFIKFSSFFVKPVVPITTFFFSFEAIFKTSNVHFGIVKSIITFALPRAFSVFNSGLIPLIFLLMDLFSVRATNLVDLSLIADLMSCWPIRPMQPVMAKLILPILMI